MPYLELKIDGKNTTIQIDKRAEHCPYCNKLIQPELITGSKYYEQADEESIFDHYEIIFRCPNELCKRIFIAIYRDMYLNADFKYLFTIPRMKKKQEFDENIRKVSMDFCNIWNQALFAEKEGFNQICGCGYRKALEYLIKDYICYINPIEKEGIATKFLGKCIQDDIDNPKIKSMAERAAWLGNDETHYLRKWNDKDISDLKRLIELTLHWISMELLTKDYEENMNDDKP